MPKFPGRLQHQAPAWIESGAVYHIRIRIDAEFSRSLIDTVLAPTLLQSAASYHQHDRWSCRLFLLMPDHIHALLAFPSHQRMGDIIGSWKAYHAKKSQILWQKNFFDHRIRSKEELAAKAAYILHNPVVKGLCEKAEDWPWLHSGTP